MARFIQLKESHEVIGDSAIALPGGGSIVTEVVKTGEALIVAQSVIGSDGKVITSQTCGYCSGVLIGCADCPGGRISVNCVTRTVSCY